MKTIEEKLENIERIAVLAAVKFGDINMQIDDATRRLRMLLDDGDVICE